MRTLLWNLWFYGLWWINILANGFFLYQLCRPFVALRKGRLWQVLFLLTLAGSSGMVIWVGDPNLLYTLPVYLLLFLLCTKGDLTGRLAICIIFFCLEMSVCVLLDTYVMVLDKNHIYDVLVRLLRTVIFGVLWLLLRRRFAAEQVRLSRRLWQMVLGLAAMPLCALVAVVLLTFQKYHSDAVNTLAMNQGLVVLPFVLLTSIVLLFAVLILADHQRLERANQLSGLREIYYQGLRQQESQVRQLRHDLRNHLTVIQGLLEKTIPKAPLTTWSKWLALRPCRAAGDFATMRPPMWFFPPKRKLWNGWELRWILPYLSPGIFQWPISIWLRCWETLWTTPSKVCRMQKIKKSPFAAG